MGFAACEPKRPYFALGHFGWQGLVRKRSTCSSSGGQGNSLGYTVTWQNSNQKTRNWDSTNQVWVTNTVTVTVTYNWAPQAYFASRTLSSTSVMTMSY